MNRLRIVIEETEPGVYVCKYVGRDAGKAQAALGEPTSHDVALFNCPHVTKYNRPLIEDARIPVEGGEETPAEEVPISHDVDEAAELVGGPTEAPKAKAKPSKKAK